MLNSTTYANSLTSRSSATKAKATFRPTSSFNYIIGNEHNLSEKHPSQIKRSTYCPNITPLVFKTLASHTNARNLYLLGVKYIEAKGGDIQAGISETRHYHELEIDNGIRGVNEELHIHIEKSSLKFFGQKFSFDHFIMDEIVNSSQYKIVDINDIHPDPSKDNKINKQTTCVYVFGTFENLLPILQAYQPPPLDKAESKHDKIDHLCMIPFSDLKNFRKY